MSQATEFIAKQLMNGSANARVWADILFNVKSNAAKGDGTTDDTAAVQATVNAAHAVGGSYVFFPQGTYKVTSLTNTTGINFIGDNAKFLGVPIEITPLSKNYNLQLSNADRFRNYLRTPSQEIPIVLIGDSITEGTKTLDFVNDGFGGIIRKAIQKEYQNKNQGFVSFRDLSAYVPTIAQYHTLTKSGFIETFDANYYGGIRLSSTTSAGYVEMTYIGQDARLVYGGRADGGILNVSVDSVVVGTIDTSVIGAVPNASKSLGIAVSAWGEHIIRLTKADAKPTDLCGMMYNERSTGATPVLHNVGRSSIKAVEIPDVILDNYTDGGAVVLALGVNDQAGAADLTTFQNKIAYVASRVNAKSGSLIVCDFMFSLPYDNAYKAAIRSAMSIYPQFDLIDFGRLWFGNSTTNQFSGLLDADGVHPTVAGHEHIANVIMEHMNLPYSKNTSKYVEDAAYRPLTLQNSWINFGGAFNDAGVKKTSIGKVEIRGLIKSGVGLTSTALFTLPKSYRPKKDIIRAVASNGAYCEISIGATGIVQLNTAGGTWVSLEGISFDLD